MNAKFLIAAATGALLFSTTTMAQAQQQQSNVLGQLLGAIFGNEQASEQALESDWNQGRRPFAQRRATLEARIEASVRDGSLSRVEADQIRREYYEIVQLEDQYSAGGTMSAQQRRDLRTRYRALSQRISGQDSDQGSVRWQPLSTRSTEFEQRVAAGLRNRSLTQAEANRLRREWRALVQLETSYQRGGLDAREEADLVARYNDLDNRLGSGSSGGFGDDRNTARWRNMETQLATAERNGRISRNEAAQVRAQLGDLERLDTAYRSGGYSADERSYLTRRYAELERMLDANRR